METGNHYFVQIKFFPIQSYTYSICQEINQKSIKRLIMRNHILFFEIEFHLPENLVLIENILVFFTIKIQPYTDYI